MRGKLCPPPLEDPDGIQVGVGVTSIADFDDGMDNVGNEMITAMGGVVLKNRLDFKTSPYP